MKLHWLFALTTGAILGASACSSSNGGSSTAGQGDDGGTPPPGDDASPAATFYGYVYPEPAGCSTAVMPAGATWSEHMHEWFLPYEAVRTAADPAAALPAKAGY